MNVRCPICGEISKTDAAFAPGDALECPYCKEEFIYGEDTEENVGTSLVAQHQKIQNSTLRSEVVFKRFYDPIILEKIRLGTISNLQDREIWQKILITLKVRKPVPVVCDKCWRFNVGFFRDKGEVVRCQCGQEFSANHGNNVFSSLMTAMRNYVEKGKYIYSLHKKFNSEEMIFQEDWNAFVDPKTVVRIERVKDELDRAYRKLQIAESKKAVVSTHRQTAAIAAYANTLDRDSLGSSLLTLSGLIGMSSCDSQLSELGLQSYGIEENVGRMERILGYYYDVKEEFTGVDRDSAKLSRLQARTGYTSIEELPKLYQNEDVSKCETIIAAVSDTIWTRARSACMWVLPLGVTSALLMVGVAVFVSIHATNAIAIGLLWVVAILWWSLWITLIINWSGKRTFSFP